MRSPTRDCDPLAHMGHVRRIAEAHTGRSEFATALDEHPFRTVDHDIGNQVVFEQGLERATSQHVVDQFARVPLFPAIELDALWVAISARVRSTFLGQFLLCPALPVRSDPSRRDTVCRNSTIAAPGGRLGVAEVVRPLGSVRSAEVLPAGDRTRPAVRSIPGRPR